MRAKLAGMQYFNDKVIIMDPGSNSLYKEIAVRPGNYKCFVWIKEEKILTKTGERYSYPVCTRIGIHLGEVPRDRTLEKICTVKVDTGRVGFFSKFFRAEDSGIKDLYKFTEKGFIAGSGHGNGIYDVFVARDKNGIINSVEISFC